MTTRSPRGRIGSTIREKYRVDTFIATGSMANVYAATHRNGGKVALKILHRELASDPKMRERFKREGYFANAIDHPGIAKAIDDDVTEDDCPFIVMDLLEGENLEVRRKRIGGRLPLGEVLTIADGVLDVLAIAHEKRILHRDLKPENIFLTHENAVKLLDFGVARFDDGKQSSEVTGVGMVLGTPAFMPPEQALGLREEVDARSDLWALGATLFTLLTGESVHTGDTAKAKLVATATKPARKLREVLPNLPSAVTSVIDRALEYHRSERWDDAKAMREALRWARMPLEHEAEVMTSSSPMLAAPAHSADTTRRVRAFSPVDDEPTVMRKAPSDDVFTSAPPITARSIVTAARSTIPDDGPFAMSESGESIAFSLRNDPVFSLRRPSEKPDKKTDPPPNTQRLPGTENDLGLPPLVPEGPPSEDVRMEYTRPFQVPGGLRGTLPLTGSSSSTTTSPGIGPIPGLHTANTTNTGSTPAAVPVPPAPSSNPHLGSGAPPSNPQLPSGAPPSNPQPMSSQRAISPPQSSNTGTKVLLALLLVAMLGGTVVVLRMRAQSADIRPTPTAIVQAPPPSAAASEAPSGAPSTEPASSAIAAASGSTSAPAGSASAEPIASASASAIASAGASAVASAAPVEPKPKPRPRPKPSATATATATATTTATAGPDETSTAAPAPVPVPVPVPTPTPSEETP